MNNIIKNYFIQNKIAITFENRNQHLAIISFMGSPHVPLSGGACSYYTYTEQNKNCKVTHGCRASSPHHEYWTKEYTIINYEQFEWLSNDSRSYTDILNKLI